VILLVFEEYEMSDLKELIEKSRLYRMTDSEKEAQRRSFAYGNAKIENDRITKEMIDKAADGIKR
jgi:predicted metal-binding protein